MEYKQKNLDELRAKMLGKTADEIDEGIKNGEISFDKEKYEIRNDNRTLAGSYAYFTPKYRRRLAKLTTLRHPSMQGLIKLDRLLSAGGSLTKISKEKMYLYEKSIEYRTPSSMLVIYLVMPEGSSIYPDREAEILFFANGRFKRGSHAMNRSKEKALLENAGLKLEDLQEKEKE